VDQVAAEAEEPRQQPGDVDGVVVPGHAGVSPAGASRDVEARQLLAGVVWPVPGEGVREQAGRLLLQALLAAEERGALGPDPLAVRVGGGVEVDLHPLGAEAGAQGVDAEVEDLARVDEAVADDVVAGVDRTQQSQWEGRQGKEAQVDRAHEDVGEVDRQAGLPLDCAEVLVHLEGRRVHPGSSPAGSQRGEVPGAPQAGTPGEEHPEVGRPEGGSRVELEGIDAAHGVAS
jgi:hypothetical protein